MIRTRWNKVKPEKCDEKKKEIICVCEYLFGQKIIFTLIHSNGSTPQFSHSENGFKFVNRWISLGRLRFGVAEVWKAPLHGFWITDQ